MTTESKKKTNTNDNRYIALIAHDDKKLEMINLLRDYTKLLLKEKVVATNTTGTLIEENLTIPVTKMLSGPMGGDLQIGGLIAESKVKLVIFLRDPLSPHPHEPDISALMKVCDTHNIPLSTNIAGAKILLDKFLLND